MSMSKTTPPLDPNTAKLVAAQRDLSDRSATALWQIDGYRSKRNDTETGVGVIWTAKRS